MPLRPDTLAMTALLGLLTALGPLSTDMYLPSLPFMATALGSSTAETQLTLSGFLVGFALGQLIYGPISDQIGRKPALLAGLALFTLASGLCALAPSMETLIVFRVLQALGAAGPIVLARSIVRDLYSGPRAAKELARMGTIMGFVPMVAPILGGLTQVMYGWRASFIVIFAIGVVGLFAVARLLPESAPKQPSSATRMGFFGRYRGFFSDAQYLRHVGLACLTYGGLFAFISGSSFVLQNIYGLGPQAFGFAFAICVGGYITGTVLAARLTMRIGIQRTLSIGILALVAGGLGMVVSQMLNLGVVGVLATMSVYLAGVGLTLPQTFAAAVMPYPDRAGAASSLLGFCQMSFGALVGISVGQALDGSGMPLALAVALCGVGAFLLDRLVPAAKDEPATGHV